MDVTLPRASATRLRALFVDWPPAPREVAAASLDVLLDQTQDGLVRLHRDEDRLLIEDLGTGARVQLQVPVGC